MASKVPTDDINAFSNVLTGLSGLAAALSLRRVGHNVTVLERDVEILKGGPGGGCRLTPNMTKVLMHWGLKPELQARGVRKRSVVFNKTDEDGALGKHTYHDEVLLESGGGEWFFISHTELRGLLYTAATNAGANVRPNCTVTAVDAVARQVTLASGEVVTGDVIIGADGPKGICRETVVGAPTTGTPTGTTLYNATMSAEDVAKVSEMMGGPEESEVAVYVWYGDGWCLYSYQMNPQGDHALHLYGPDDGQDGTWSDEPSVSLPKLLENLEPKLAKFVENASLAVRVRMMDYGMAEDWVHETSDRLLIIGEAAHPFPPGALQTAAMSMEDAAVLGKLFSHLKSEDQIGNMVCGFQDIREERCKMALEREVYRAQVFTLKKGPEQEARDKTLRLLNKDKGFDLGLYSLEEPRVLFAYDCEDQGEEWWQSWGLLRERAHNRRGNPLKVTMHVEVQAGSTSV
ncbi:hypothetical protein NM688_g8876 [Phlebia brevispora]|uniref:Uncharacterized protein n=1 Tax=Phlebia brevispora TaxID=194682 RepID=A0ACC1RPJ1_9APHY|nr:hypothetical protein NM688_g8876 [Phlebia brevispora]